MVGLAVHHLWHILSLSLVKASDLDVWPLLRLPSVSCAHNFYIIPFLSHSSSLNRQTDGQTKRQTSVHNAAS